MMRDIYLIVVMVAFALALLILSGCSVKYVMDDCKELGAGIYECSEHVKNKWKWGL